MRTSRAVSEDDGKVFTELGSSPGGGLLPRHGLAAFPPRSIQPSGGQGAGGKRIDGSVRHVNEKIDGTVE